MGEEARGVQEPGLGVVQIYRPRQAGLGVLPDGAVRARRLVDRPRGEPPAVPVGRPVGPRVRGRGVVDAGRGGHRGVQAAQSRPGIGRT
jgi:hypothetical protein